MEIRNFGPFDWITITVFLVAAFIMAADAALKSSSDPLKARLHFITESKPWNYLPLAMMTTGLIIVSGRFAGYIGKSQLEKGNLDGLSWLDVPATTIVRNRDFRNQEVPLDGVRYENCKFFNVTFQFNGTRPFELVNDSISGPIEVGSKNAVVDATVLLLYGFNILKPEFIVRRDPNSGVVEPLKKE